MLIFTTEGYSTLNLALSPLVRADQVENGKDDRWEVRVYDPAGEDWWVAFEGTEGECVEVVRRITEAWAAGRTVCYLAEIRPWKKGETA